MNKVIKGNEYTVTVYFFRFFMTYLLPYEVKYSTIAKRKDFNLHKNIIDIFLKICDTSATQKEFELIVKNEIEPIALRVQKNYYLKLVRTFGSRISSEVIFEALSLSQRKKYKDAISVIEKELGIEQQNLVQHSNDLHMSSSIYYGDFEKIKKILPEFIEAYTSFNESIFKEELKIHNKEKREIITENEYLTYVVYNEAWNFLSHLSYAISYFDTPKSFIGNIEKGLSHLTRAILDIYDGLIVETQEITPEYLSIRAIKLSSLGSDRKITSLRTLLKDYYHSQRK